MRNNRPLNSLREINITRNYTKHAEGSVLIEFGNTKVICTASVQQNFVPRFLKGKGQGWLTAEYGMLPRSTNSRMDREAARGKQSGRTQEIQRLIGRSLRAMLDLNILGEHTIVVDCDVIQADGGTRTAAITGGAVALIDALNYLQRNKVINTDPLINMVAAISVGVLQDHSPAIDLDYNEDSTAHTDMNIVMTDNGEFIELQGTAEDKAFNQEQLNQMLNLAKSGISELIAKQKAALEMG